MQVFGSFSLSLSRHQTSDDLTVGGQKGLEVRPRWRLADGDASLVPLLIEITPFALGIKQSIQWRPWALKRA